MNEQKKLTGAPFLDEAFHKRTEMPAAAAVRFLVLLSVALPLLPPFLAAAHIYYTYYYGTATGRFSADKRLATSLFALCAVHNRIWVFGARRNRSGRVIRPAEERQKSSFTLGNAPDFVPLCAVLETRRLPFWHLFIPRVRSSRTQTQRVQWAVRGFVVSAINSLQCDNAGYGNN